MNKPPETAQRWNIEAGATTDIANPPRQGIRKEPVTNRVFTYKELEKLIEQARQETAREIWDQVVCPLCYRLNPHHAHENNGKGCNWCSEKEHYTGQTVEQSLTAKQ